MFEVPLKAGMYRYFGPLNMERLVITSPAALSEFFSQKAYSFQKPDWEREGMGVVLGQTSLLFSEGKEHKGVRRKFLPAFNVKHLQGLVPVFWAKSTLMVETICQQIPTGGQWENIDLIDLCTSATLDIIGSAGFGMQFNSLQGEKSDLNKAYREGELFQFPQEQGIRKLLFAAQFLPLLELIKLIPPSFFPNGDKGAWAQTHLLGWAEELAKGKLRSATDEKDGEGGKFPRDILSILAKDGEITLNEFRDNVLTFLAAGHETTSTAVSWCIQLMGLHQEIQTRLRAEIHAAFPGGMPETITVEELTQLKYLKAVCDETLRLRPPVTVALRDASEDTSLAGQFIPKGSTVIASIIGLNTSEEYWGPTAKIFDPDRWLNAPMAQNGGKPQHRSNYAFSTFIHGPRSCIGEKFARLEMECLVLALVGAYEWIPVEGVACLKDLGVKDGITNRPLVAKIRCRKIDW